MVADRVGVQALRLFPASATVSASHVPLSIHRPGRPGSRDPLAPSLTPEQGCSPTGPSALTGPTSTELGPDRECSP